MSKKDVGIDLKNFSFEKEIAKFEGIITPGYKVAVRLYIEPKMKGNFEIPDSAHDEQQYQSCVGLVVGMGPDAFADPVKFPSGKWCKLGDWITFPRHSGCKITIDGMTTFVLNDDSVLLPVNDPTRITR